MIARPGEALAQAAAPPPEEDVVATTPVEVLAVDQRFLTRFQRRYPRIASRVFLNLTRILSDRLEGANLRFLQARAATTRSATG